MSNAIAEPDDVTEYIQENSVETHEETCDQQTEQQYQVGQSTDEEDTTADQKMLEQLEEGNSVVDAADMRSVFVGNVDYGATPTELQEHFRNCGAINRITIMIDRYTGHPKGYCNSHQIYFHSYAYIEFQEPEGVNQAVALNQSTFRDRQLKVLPKRKNMPGFSVRKRGGTVMGPVATRQSFVTRGTRFPIAYTHGRGGFRGSMNPYHPRYRKRGPSHVVQPY